MTLFDVSSFLASRETQTAEGSRGIEQFLEERMKSKFRDVRCTGDTRTVVRHVEYRLPNIKIAIGDSPGFESHSVMPAAAATQSFLFRITSGIAVTEGNRERAATAGQVIAVPHGRERRILGFGGCSIELAVPETVLRGKLESLTHERVPELEWEEVDDFRNGRSRVVFNEIVNWLRGVSEGDFLERSETIWQRVFEDTLLALLVLQVPHSRADILSRPVACIAPRAVKRAEGFIRENAGRPLTLEEIARAVECTPRSLQRSFIKFRQTTPMGFLRDTRYGIALTRLKDANTTSVTDVAKELGFSNIGRFAKEFRRRFGKSPSQILLQSDP
jgi:AraC-like DNA-binding protein